jgi:hypothetical protein
VVSQQEPEQRLGVYWGYNVGSLSTFSEMFQNLDEKCIKILVDVNSTIAYSDSLRTRILDKMVVTDAKEVFVFFTGKGLRYLFDNDEQTKIAFDKIRSRFDFEFQPLISGFGLKNFHLDEQIEYYLHELFNRIDP